MWTGHAACVAVEALASESYRGTVVVAVGDMLTVLSVVAKFWLPRTTPLRTPS
jgi:hypothetical protein